MSVVSGYPIPLPDVPVVYRGMPFDWKLVMHDADGNPVDLTAFGTTWDSELRLCDTSQAAFPFNVDVTHLADGYIVLALTAAETSTMGRSDGAPLYEFDVRAQGGAETPFYVWAGKLATDGNVTRG